MTTFDTSLFSIIFNSLRNPFLFMFNPDRLVRFGFEIIEEVCKTHNCELVVLNKEDKTPEKELIEDLISILVSFSEKLQGIGSHKYEKVKKCVEELKA